ncbi:hypothetical protein PUNSTDRAFT_146998 [Punctularia strigosozonata HHB-11173 SS5]|uniref:Rhodopsin domain-containing protein n=1 Tax=Punctularia strigosozonata (strain HHB-11173) TaxID=741275 RepID=R7S196_PUNST|nr:uncharacterized protein PUNSTDRAFT_146998 [Punctularia strigosozonata HHB-11173 SS5]EIN03562.1 hypothetical protein PUNSTDRAFT_146998 [Punctularia strigosozonata HHB-11173 SS5]
MITSLEQLKISSGVCASIAIISTVLRLYLRRRRYGWDDGFALVSMIFQIVQMVAVFLHLPDSTALPHLTNIALYYIMATTFYCIIWTARLSILHSIIRIDSHQLRAKILRWVAVVFAVILVVMNCQLFWVCEPIGSTWKPAAFPQCPIGKQVVTTQLVTDILSDLLLLSIPLRLLSSMHTDKATSRRLMIIFSTSVVTTIVSLVHAAFIFEHGQLKIVIAAVVENAVSLMVCNVPVLATAALRAVGQRDSLDDTSGRDPSSRYSTGIKFRSRTQNTTFGSLGRPTGSGSNGQLGVHVSTHAITLTDISSGIGEGIKGDEYIVEGRAVDGPDVESERASEAKITWVTPERFDVDR